MKPKKQTKSCTDDCKEVHYKYSRFTFDENTVMFVSTDKDTWEKDIRKMENCMILDKNNWDCGETEMFDGVLFWGSIYVCAK